MQKPSGGRDRLVAIVTGSVLGAVVCVYAYYFWLRQPTAEPQPPAPALTQTPAPEPEPEVHYPMQASVGDKPLPSLEESDPALQAALTELLNVDIRKQFHLDSLARRVVVTIDELPRKKLPQKYSLTKPVGGKYLVAGNDDDLAISPNNYRRYTPFVKLAESVDTGKLVAVYSYFYPLLEEEYRNLGYTRKYLNDRVVETIDDLLAAPEAKEPVRLVQNKVMYEYADAALEELSAGQKVMLRMGNDNATRVKAKLREIRAEITRRPDKAAGAAQ
jgi:hypothetical protein